MELQKIQQMIYEVRGLKVMLQTWGTKMAPQVGVVFAILIELCVSHRLTAYVQFVYKVNGRGVVRLPFLHGNTCLSYETYETHETV